MITKEEFIKRMFYEKEHTGLRKTTYEIIISIAYTSYKMGYADARIDIK